MKKIVLDINLSYICNLKCKFCMTKEMREKEKDFLNYNEVRLKLLNLLNKIRLNYEIEKIILLGGEPTILPYIFDLIVFLTNFTEEIGISTNGLKLSDKSFAERLKKSGLTFVNLSIHHYKNNVIDFLSGISGFGLKQKKALENLKKLGIKTNLNCVIQKSNFNSLDKYFIYYFKKYGVKSVGYNFLQIEGYALDNLDNVLCLYSDVNFNKYIKFFNLVRKIDPNIMAKFSEIPFCVSSVNIKDYINFFIDNEYILKGRIGYRESFKDLRFEIQSNIRKNVKIKDLFCKKCFLYNNCEGFWKRNYTILKEDISYLRENFNIK